jgi:formate dehydrogenase subunit gamma
MNTHKELSIRRFGASRLIEHNINAIVFLLLVVTGLCQRFHDSGFSQWIIVTLGGVDMTRLIHHYLGFFFSVLLVAHVVQACIGVLFIRWQPSMMITVKDYRDAITNLYYYFGLADHPAQCGRYDYRQKFEYWGVIAGGVLMIITGFILWFPVQSAKFLPAELIPAAKTAHSNEALLAFLVIAIWHIYNSVFSPEVFPLDTTIFTGKISRERMLHEHPLELAALEGVSVDDLLKQAHAGSGQEENGQAPARR